jgi:hypothetical protein
MGFEPPAVRSYVFIYWCIKVDVQTKSSLQIEDKFYRVLVRFFADFYSKMKFD